MIPSKEDYGSVETMIVGVNCVNPKLLKPAKDFETGLMIYRKYTDGAKLLDFIIKLNYGDTLKASESEVIDLFMDGLLKSYSGIQKLNIKGFDVERLYADLKRVLQNRSWLNEPYTEKIFYYNQPPQERSDFLQNEKMPLDIFWNLIEKARISNRGF